MSRPTAHEAAIDPEWIPHTFDVEGVDLTFVNVPRDARPELLFLSDEYYQGRFAEATFPAPAIAAEAGASDRAPVHFIFHTSFCGSTLLARAIEAEPRSSVLREPAVLVNLANRLIRSDDAANRERIELALRLLERPLSSGETVIVKPTNFSNRLVDVLLTSRPEAKAVLLYSEVESFMRSMLMRGVWGRVVGRKLFLQLSGWSSLKFGYDQSELFEQTDVQIAALAWLMQIHHFDQMARRFGRDRVLIMNSGELIADPSTALSQVQDLFGLGWTGEQVKEIATGPVFAKHSKESGRDYSPQQRAEDHKAATEIHGEELSMVTQWISAVAAHVQVPLQPDYE